MTYEEYKGLSFAQKILSAVWWAFVISLTSWAVGLPFSWRVMLVYIVTVVFSEAMENTMVKHNERNKSGGA